MNRSDPVWEQRRYDAGWYTCQVVRDGEFARLNVCLCQRPSQPGVGLFDFLLHSTRVNFTQPDPDKWRSICEHVISHPDERVIEPR